MKNLLRILAIGLALVILAGCAGPMRQVTTTFSEGGVPQRTIKTEGNVSSEQLERLQHGAVLERVPGERTHIDIDIDDGGNKHSSDVLRRAKKIEDKILGRKK
jgi:hypothetical protein